MRFKAQDIPETKKAELLAKAQAFWDLIQKMDPKPAAEVALN